MTKYVLRVKVYQPMLNSVALPDFANYYAKDFDCEIEQIFHSPDENTVIFNVDLPKNYIITSKSEKARTAETVEEQLELLYDEIGELGCDVENMTDEISGIDRETVEKIKNVRRKLESIKIELGEIE